MTGTRTEPEPPAPTMAPAAPASPAAPGRQATRSVSPSTAELSRRRRRALDDVAADQGPDERRADQPAVALRDYGPGCVCLGIAGPVDRAMAERLQALLRELRGRGRGELVITLGGLGPWHPQLARVLAHARIQHLIDGAPVEFHDLPDLLATKLGPAAATRFLVAETNPADLSRGHHAHRLPRPARRASPRATPQGGTRR